jgi:tetratricopeptide (TPR) repeat protein
MENLMEPKVLGKILICLLCISLAGCTAKATPIQTAGFEAAPKAARSPVEEAGIHLLQGSAFFERGDLDQAITEFTKAIALNPKLAVAYEKRGAALSMKGRYAEALADSDRALDLNKALELDKDLYFVYASRGFVFYKQSKLDQALADYDKALQMRPEEAELYNNRGLVHASKGQVDQALADYQKASELSPEWFAPYLNKALVCDANGMTAEALRAYQQFLQLAPPHLIQTADRARSRIKQLTGGK